MRRGIFYAAGALVVCLHGAAALDAARKLSPSWDEIITPAAGVAQWRRGAVEINTEHPFLAKLLAGAFPAMTGAVLPVDDPSWKAKDSFRFGFQFMFRNVVSGPRLVFLSRLPFVLLSMLTVVLLIGWMASVFGPAAGLLSGSVYAATPIVLSRASSALLEGPVFFFLLLALACQDRWRRTDHRRWVWASGAAMGGALACKMSALPMAGAFLFSEFLWEGQGRSWRKRTAAAALYAAAVVGSLVFIAWPWTGGAACLREAFTFVSRWTGGRDSLYFWAGRYFANPGSLLTWGPFFLKASPFFLLAGAAGAWVWFRSGRERVLWGLTGTMVAAFFLSPVLASSALSSVQLSPVHLGLAIFSAGAALLPGKRRAILGGVLLLGMADAARSHPDYMAYLSPVVGGNARGGEWVGDSDHDWGQWLPALARYVDRESKRSPVEVLLCYSGAGDPAAYGIVYQDVVSSALVSRDHQGMLPSAPGPRTLLAVGDKILQTEGYLTGWLKINRRSVPGPDPCFQIYDVTRDAEAYRWMARVYLETRRPAFARWAIERARTLDPGNREDKQFVEALK